MAEEGAVSKILRKPAVLDRLGVSATTLWRMQRAGTFPPSIQISPGTVGWIESDIDRWIAARVEAAR